MYGYIYRTTNNVDGMKYIGQHARPEFDNSYYGSGIHIKRAINKYGKENFSIEVLAWGRLKKN